MEKEFTIIPAKKGKNKVGNVVKKLRVAAYCRVSTDNEEQEESYKIQVEHYETYINHHTEWELAGVYADEGISGLNTKKRYSFTKMIDDCHAGKIDMIITKSISRFARNTVDCLRYIRDLKILNIPVIFESENINTCDATGEFMLTILASLAQQESENISRNVKLSLKFRYQKGMVMVNHNKFLGYDRDENGQLIINEYEATIVRLIFEEYLAGKSPGQIAKMLEARGILTGAGKHHWRNGTILKMLQNEKYIGDNLTQKTITVDTLNKIRKPNKGDEEQYYIKNTHSAIISRDIFEKVREELRRRRELKKAGERIYPSKYPLSDVIICGYCESRFYRLTRYCPGKKKDYEWICKRRLYGKGNEKCEMRIVKERLLQQYVIEAISQVGVSDSADYSDELVKNYIKKITIFDDYVLVETIELT